MEDFVNYDIAVKLKEKGFKEKCFAYYLPENVQICFVNSSYRGCIYEDCAYSHNSLPLECFGSEYIDAPAIPKVLKWFRENHKIYVSIMTFMFRAGWQYEVIRLGENPKLLDAHRNSYKTYEKAAIAGIEYVLNNLI